MKREQSSAYGGLISDLQRLVNEHPFPQLCEQTASGRGSLGTPFCCCPLQLGVPGAGCRVQGQGSSGCLRRARRCLLSVQHLLPPAPAPAPSPLLHNCSEPSFSMASACPSAAPAAPRGAGTEPCHSWWPGASRACPGQEGRARLAAQVRGTGHGSPVGWGWGGEGIAWCWVQPVSRGGAELPVSLPSPAEHPGGHREQ